MVWFTPVLHPAAIIRGMWSKEPFQEITLRRIGKFLMDGTEPAPWDIHEPPPRSTLYPSLEDLTEFYESTKREGWDALSHDLENAGNHIICDSITQLNLETGEVGRSLCLRFRLKGGVLYWPDRESLTKAAGWLWWVLADPDVAVVAHNGITHDVPILELAGFVVGGRLIDTMIMQHTAYSEMQKGLQFCATMYSEAPVWKVLTDGEDDEKG